MNAFYAAANGVNVQSNSSLNSYKKASITCRIMTGRYKKG